MFDFRYHVASLAAVFLMLVVGILRRRRHLRPRLRRRRRARPAQRPDRGARAAGRGGERVRGRAPTSGSGRARSSSRARTLCSSTGGSTASASRCSCSARATSRSTSSGGRIVDGDGRVARMRAVDAALAARGCRVGDRRQGRSSAGYVGEEQLGNLGRDLGRELAAGGETPLWDALEGEIVEERVGDFSDPVDGVVVMRTAEPQAGDDGPFPRRAVPGPRERGRPGRRRRAEPGRARARSPSSSATASRPSTGSTPSSAGSRSSSCSAGADPGDYGVRDTADDGIVPPIVPLPAGD